MEEEAEKLDGCQAFMLGEVVCLEALLHADNVQIGGCTHNRFEQIFILQKSQRIHPKLHIESCHLGHEACQHPDQ